MWAAGCVVAELWYLKPLFRGVERRPGEPEDGAGELDQLGKIFMYRGTPTEASWPGMSSLARFVEFEPCAPVAAILPPGTHPDAEALVAGLLTLDPNQRTAAQQGLGHPFLTESPPPTTPESLPR